DARQSLRRPMGAPERRGGARGGAQGPAVVPPVRNPLGHVPEGLHRRPFVPVRWRTKTRGDAGLSQELREFFVDSFESLRLGLAGALRRVCSHASLLVKK